VEVLITITPPAPHLVYVRGTDRDAKGHRVLKDFEEVKKNLLEFQKEAI